ncbi:hypothetical protein MY8738_002640 [Beauveria namnaoensis]
MARRLSPLPQSGATTAALHYLIPGAAEPLQSKSDEEGDLLSLCSTSLGVRLSTLLALVLRKYSPGGLEPVEPGPVIKLAEMDRFGPEHRQGFLCFFHHRYWGSQSSSLVLNEAFASSYVSDAIILPGRVLHHLPSAVVHGPPGGEDELISPTVMTRTVKCICSFTRLTESDMSGK